MFETTGKERKGGKEGKEGRKGGQTDGRKEGSR
jgi:hypothetical protein